MRKIAIVYSTKYGQTEKIARYMADWLQQRGISTLTIDASSGAPISSEVNGVIYGGPVYRGKFPKKLILWVKKNKESMARIPTALFTVSLNAADKRPEAREADLFLIQKFIEQSSFAPRMTASFAGALKYREYFWPIRLIMRRISRLAGGDIDTSRNYEYTSWPKVDAFLNVFQNMKRNDSSPVDPAQRRVANGSHPLTNEEWDQVIL